MARGRYRLRRKSALARAPAPAARIDDTGRDWHWYEVAVMVAAVPVLLFSSWPWRHLAFGAVMGLAFFLHLLQYKRRTRWRIGLVCFGLGAGILLIEQHWVSREVFFSFNRLWDYDDDNTAAEIALAAASVGSTGALLLAWQVLSALRRAAWPAQGSKQR